MALRLQRAVGVPHVLVNGEAVVSDGVHTGARPSAVGVPHVLVNGEAVVSDGVHTGARPSKVLRRGA